MAYIGNVTGFDTVDTEQIKDGAVSDAKISDVDHSKVTGLATEISTAVSNLVDSSPASLNTLNELAAALGDDASFSTTVTNSIATKLPLAGGTMTGNLAINNAASGYANIEIGGTDGSYLDLKSPFSDDYDMRFITSGSGGAINANGTLLIQHTGATKLATSTTGVDVTGVVTTDGLTTSGDLVVNTTGNTPVVWVNTTGSGKLSSWNKGGAEKAFITNNGGASFGSNVDVTGSVTADGLTVDGATILEAASGQLRLQGTTTTAKNVSIQYSESGDYGQINCDQSGVNQKDLWVTGLNLKFGRSTGSESMRITSSGLVGIGTLAPYTALQVGDPEDTAAQMITIASRYGASGGGGPILNFRSGHGSNTRVWDMARIMVTDDGNYNGRIEFQTSNPAYNPNTDLTTKMVIKSNGNTGVGTTSPTSKLHISGTQSYGSLRISPAAANGEAAMAFYSDVAGSTVNTSWVVGSGGWGNPGDFVVGNENGGAGGNVRLLVERAGAVKKPSQPIISGQMNSAQTDPVAPILLSFNEFWTNSGITFNATTKRFTVPTSGTYRITLNPFFKTGVGAGRVLVGVNTDSPAVTNHRGHAYRQSTNYETGCINSVVYLAANDYIVFKLHQGALYNQTSDRFNQFSIELIG